MMVHVVEKYHVVSHFPKTLISQVKKIQDLLGTGFTGCGIELFSEN